MNLVYTIVGMINIGEFPTVLYISTCCVHFTVNQKVCSSHQIKRESLVTIVTPKYGVMRTPHRLGVKYTPNLV